MHASIRAHVAELRALCRRHRVHRLELFGSAVGVQDPEDFDFLVEFEPLDSDDYADTYFDLREDLERLLRRPVDLVMTSAITNPYFLADIAQDRTIVYGS